MSFIFFWNDGMQDTKGVLHKDLQAILGAKVKLCLFTIKNTLRFYVDKMEENQQPENCVFGLLQYESLGCLEVKKNERRREFTEITSLFHLFVKLHEKMQASSIFHTIVFCLMLCWCCRRTLGKCFYMPLLMYCNMCFHCSNCLWLL